MSASVLVIGSGGRENAIAWKLAQSPRVARVVVAPGNDGMPGLHYVEKWGGRKQQLERWQLSLAGDIEQRLVEYDRIAKKAVKEKIDLAVIGPDNQLADGIADILAKNGILTFGPSKAASQIEASKAFAKEVMTLAAVSTPKFEIVSSLEEANKVINSWPADTGIVVKADGLAFGKGVKVCENREEALEAAKELVSVSGKLVIEEKVSGEEVSIMGFCDGERCALLEPARDYKRLNDGDEGPNTGGMGAFSPVPGVSKKFCEKIRTEVFVPVLNEMNKRRTPFKGVLYAGLMVEPQTEKYWVLEFNSRFGDPETQAVLPRLDDDFYVWCDSVARGNISRLPRIIPFKPDSAVFVVAASKGYPENPEKGLSITGVELEQIWDEMDRTAKPSYFMAGVSVNSQGQLMTSGGRVLGALGVAADLTAARARAYDKLKKVKFKGMHFRTDIAQVQSKEQKTKDSKR